MAAWLSGYLTTEDDTFRKIAGIRDAALTWMPAGAGVLDIPTGAGVAFGH